MNAKNLRRRPSLGNAGSRHLAPNATRIGAPGRQIFDKCAYRSRLLIRYIIVTNPSSTLNVKDTNTSLPPVGEVVLVQCENFRCLAFRDKYGKWRSPYSKMELNHVIHIIQGNAA